MMDVNNLAETIRKRRKTMGLTQKELADRCGLLQGIVSRLEHGLVANVGSDLISALSRGLELQPDYLAGQTKKVRASSLIERDRNARYLLRLYAGLTGAEVRQLIGFTEFMRFGATNITRLLDTFRRLLDDYEECAETNTVPDKAGPILVLAQEVAAQIVIDQAAREVELEDDNPIPGLNK